MSNRFSPNRDANHRICQGVGIQDLTLPAPSIAALVHTMAKSAMADPKMLPSPPFRPVSPDIAVTL